MNKLVIAVLFAFWMAIAVAITNAVLVAIGVPTLDFGTGLVCGFGAGIYHAYAIEAKSN